MRELVRLTAFRNHDSTNNERLIGFKDTFLSSFMFQVVWFDVLLFQTGVSYLMIALMCLHLHYVIKKPKLRFSITLVALLIIGVLLDSILTWLSVFSFYERSAVFGIPAWLAQLWIGFILSLPVAFFWLISKPLKLASVFGFLAPLSYLAGREFGFIEFANTSVIYIGFTWFIVGAIASFSLKPILLTHVHRDKDVNVGRVS